jgi:hypothetical protein
MTHERLQEIITESLRDWFKKETGCVLILQVT